MSRKRTDNGEKGLLRRVRRQRLKYITILPSLITVLNGVFGFTAIIFASRGAEQAIASVPEEARKPYFAISGYMILIAMIADMLDGQLARKVKSTSSFGGQLDSLCDVISFGAAPVFLMLKIVEFKLELMSSAGDSALQRFIWLAAAGYLSCAIIRLARFNVENEEGESAHMSFMGLPTPAAAGVIVSLIILHQQTLRPYQETLPMVDGVIYILPFLAMGLGVLMVSRIRYPHVINQYFRGRKPFGHFIRVLLLLAFLYVSKIQVALVLVFCGFAASSLLKWIYFRTPVSKLVARLNPWTNRNDQILVPSSAGDSPAVDADKPETSE